MAFWPFNARPLGSQTALSVTSSAAVGLTVPPGAESLNVSFYG